MDTKQLIEQVAKGQSVEEVIPSNFVSGFSGGPLGISAKADSTDMEVATTNPFTDVEDILYMKGYRYKLVPAPGSKYEGMPPQYAKSSSDAKAIKKNPVKHDLRLILVPLRKSKE